MERTYRTKGETIEYFKYLSSEYEIEAYQVRDDEVKRELARAKAEAYELAAFELDRNMKTELTFDINNKGILGIEQHQHDGELTLTRTDNGVITRSEVITPADFVTMLNWYRYQVDNGNTNLKF